MQPATSGLVEIVREFLALDEALRRLVERYHAGQLTWDEVATLVTDDESSPLYRLKECSHALFRGEGAGPSVARHREVLFDLAIGSLFHEAMTFRENFYQREVYGPRVRALRAEAGSEAEALFREFEKILELGSARLEESVTETRALLDRSREQLVDLLQQDRDDGLVARHLLERRELAEAGFERDLEGLFGELYGEPAAGWLVAGRSYVRSAYFEEGAAALSEAVERGVAAADAKAWIDYARGMAAYMRGDYASSVDDLVAWSAHAGDAEPGLVQQASAAMARIEHLARGPDREELARRAAEVVEALAV